MKDHIPPEKKSGIYQINCKDYENMYIKRYLETRTKYFRNIINSHVQKSEVAVYVWIEKHSVDSKLILLDQESNKKDGKTSPERPKNLIHNVNFEIPSVD